jgi:hypothetical protein
VVSALVYHGHKGGCLEIQNIHWNEVLSLPFIVGVFGVLMLIFGDRLYRLLVMAPGFFIGGYIATFHINVGSPDAQLFVTVLVSIIGGFIMLIIEKFTVALFGALLGGVFTVSLGNMVGGILSTEWYWPVLGALLGSILFPPLFKKNLAIITSGIGALCVAFSLGREKETLFVVGIASLGWLLQTALKYRRLQQIE